MKRFSEQLKKKSDTIRLRASEKAELQSRIVAFMEYHPLPASVQSKPLPKKDRILAEPYRVINISRTYLRLFAGTAAVLFVVAVPALAENSIPGDILYPVKVNVTEEIRGSLSFNSYEKVVWETTRLERRISEARLLAQAGKLTPEAEAEVLAAVEDHSKAAKAQIETLRTTDADGATLAEITFATALDVQSAVLKADGSASTTAGKSTIAISSALDIGSAAATGGSSLENLPVVRLLAQLETETTRSYELLESIKNSTSEQEQKDLKRRLSEIESRIAQSTNQASADTLQVKSDLRTSWTNIQKLISFMTMLDVRKNLSVETLVPAELSNNELLAISVDKYTQTKNDLKRIEFGLDDIDDADIKNKVVLAVPKITELLKVGSSTLQEGSTKDASVAINEASALTQSIMPLFKFPDLASVPVTVSAVSEVATSTQIELPEVDASEVISASSTIKSTIKPLN